MNINKIKEEVYKLKPKTLVEFGYPLADELVKKGQIANAERDKNKPIKDEIILQANLTGIKVLNNLDENTLNNLKNEQEISHEKREELYFPYILPEDNDFNLEDKNKSI